jgi:hypothetical protein
MRSCTRLLGTEDTRPSARDHLLSVAVQLVALSTTVVLASQMRAQGTPATPNSYPNQPWAFTLIGDGYIVPNEDGYFSPILTADWASLHLEGRYNYENLRTGSVWVGYNFSAGKKLVLSITPILGGVFGRTTGIAPGFEASLTYNKVQLSVSNEYVFDTGNRSSSFYYAWPQLTYSPIDWLHLGLVEQRTKAYQTGLDTQRGFLFGLSRKKIEFTTYVFNPGRADPVLILETSFSF